MHLDIFETVVFYTTVWFVCTLLQRNYILHSKSVRFIEGHLHIKIYSISSALSFLIFFLIIVFRENVGNDYKRYVWLYYLIGNDALSTSQLVWLNNSISYLVINKISFLCGFGYRFVFAVFAFITLFFIYRGINASSINSRMSIFLYVGLYQFYQNFNIMRQLAAVAILFWGEKFLEKDDFKRFVFIVLIAASFHSSAFVFLVLWPLRNIKMNPRNIRQYLLIGILFFFFFNYFLNVFSWTNAVSSYSTSSEYSKMFGLSTILNSGVRIFLFFFCFYFYKDVCNEYGTKYIVFYNIAAVCTIAQLGAMRFSIFGRVTVYFFIFYIILLPVVFKVMEKKFKQDSKVIIRILELLWGLLYHYTYYFSPQGAVEGGFEFYNFTTL